MRAIMARLRGPRLSPGDRVDAALARPGGPVEPGTLYALGGPGGPEPIMLPRRQPETRSYQDAVYEALDQVHKLGLDGDLGLPSMVSRDVADAIRYVYAQGWLACEARLAAPNMADQIDAAIRTPSAVVEMLPGESINRQVIRAIQHVVAHGVKSEPH